MYCRLIKNEIESYDDFVHLYVVLENVHSKYVKVVRACVVHVEDAKLFMYVYEDY
jgi:hypothetical protein